MTSRSIKDQIRKLCAREKNGDPTAAAECERRFGSSIRRIVRRVTRSRRAASAFEQYILSEADKLLQGRNEHSTPDRETVVALVTRNVCSKMLTRMNPEPSQATGSPDTFRKQNFDTLMLAH